MAVVFLMLSHLSKHKLNLPQTSKAFFYIAMGYIPIVLFSLSLLDLIGEYFSISGDGRFIYLFGASVFIMSLYYVIAISLVMLCLENTLYLLASSILIMALYYLLDVRFEKISFKYVVQMFQSITIFFRVSTVKH